MAYDSTLLMREFVTHDVKRFMVSRPEGLDWKPGQGVELSLDTPEWRDQPRPFTPTSLSEDRLIELTIKGYPEQDGVTETLHALEPGAALKLSESFGSITYQGPGTFIAAGTGVTPFLAMLRRLIKDGKPLDGHRLLVSNKCERDLIAAQELRHYLGEDLILTFTREDASEHKGRHLSTPSCWNRRYPKVMPNNRFTSADPTNSSRPRKTIFSRSASTLNDGSSSTDLCENITSLIALHLMRQGWHAVADHSRPSLAFRRDHHARPRH
jgi:cytochrome-b5 reductase